MAVVVAAAICPALAGEREGFRDRYSIMAPEPGISPRRQPLRGLQEKPNTTRTQPLLPSPRPSVATPPPPTVLPSGRAVPNLPAVNQGIVPGGGRETFGDRTARCAHQSGLFGVPTGQQGAYMHSCTQ
jgi:hypothetical protein